MNREDVLANGSVPVHPFTWTDREGDENRSEGLTKRELFAAMALQGILANPNRGSADIGTSAVLAADVLIERLNS